MSRVNFVFRTPPCGRHPGPGSPRRTRRRDTVASLSPT
ncbi:hypothetical protein CU044_6446 [Streptomyces sp. L-9-10]|nr:hypothetical protein CU044_6446 [Streptomyces sp. L-9-10]